MPRIFRDKSLLLNQEGVVHLALPLIILVAVSIFAAGNIQTSTKFDDSAVQGVIAKNENSNAGRGSSENKGPSGENKPGSPEVAKSEQQPKTFEEKTKTDSPRANTNKNVEQKETKINSKVEAKVEDEEPEDESSESADEDEDEVEDGDDEGAGIAELRSISKFPLRIDTSTNELIMTKNGVERVLTVLPAKAVQNMLRAHLKKGLGPKFFQATVSATPVGTPSATPVGTPSASATPSATPEGEPIASESADITILEDQISLDEENAQVVYKIPAKKHLKLLGFIPVTTDLTGIVSAQTGAFIEERQSLLSRILDLLSP